MSFIDSVFSGQASPNVWGSTAGTARGKAYGKEVGLLLTKAAGKFSTVNNDQTRTMDEKSSQFSELHGNLNKRLESLTVRYCEKLNEAITEWGTEREQKLVSSADYNSIHLAMFLSGKSPDEQYAIVASDERFLSAINSVPEAIHKISKQTLNTMNDEYLKKHHSEFYELGANLKKDFDSFQELSKIANSVSDRIEVNINHEALKTRSQDMSL